MRRNCNLELRLNTTSTSGVCSGTPPQLLTIFYDGMMYVSDVTEIQARAIIFLAKKEMMKRLKTSSPISSTSPCASTTAYSEPLSPSPLPSPICSPSMKKSLQTFLQKRKYRIQSTSHPYTH